MRNRNEGHLQILQRLRRMTPTRNAERAKQGIIDARVGAPSLSSDHSYIWGYKKGQKQREEKRANC